MRNYGADAPAYLDLRAAFAGCDHRHLLAGDPELAPVDVLRLLVHWVIVAALGQALDLDDC